MVRWLAAVGAMLVLGAQTGRAQIQWATGQNVAPIFEGWMRNADGSIDMIFGYLNRNWEEVLHIPVGPDNNVEPGGPDRGQPTVFVPRRVAQPPGERREQFVFRVRLPKEWRPDQELIWTVTANGKTDRAIGTLNPLEEMDNAVIAANRSFGTAAEGNVPPSVTLTASSPKVSVGESLALTAVVSDDGLPKLRRQPPRQASDSPAPAAAAALAGRMGLHVRWIHYRGPGRVTFTPGRSPIDAEGSVSGAKATATAQFTEPGTHMLRAFADDGSLIGTAEVTVNVTAAAGSSPSGRR
jgi:hypothetical protein